MGVRKLMEAAYPAYRKALLTFNGYDAEAVHEAVIRHAQLADRLGLSRFFMDTEENYMPGNIRFANAAGMNKNGTIPSQFLRYWGFDVNIVGTVTHDSWEGNPDRPRIWYYSPGSLVNFLGLPGVGSARVAENLRNDRQVLPVRISLMSTPKKEGNAAIDDILATMEDLDFAADEYELNISCPNTHNDADAGRKYQNTLYDLISPVVRRAEGKAVYLKLSPDLSRQEMIQTLDVCKLTNITGFTAFNTTTKRGMHGIPTTQKGGASGDAVYGISREAQKLLVEEIQGKQEYKRKFWSINACGGISSVGRMIDRIEIGNGMVEEIQNYTGHTYQGPSLLRKLRRAAHDLR